MNPRAPFILVDRAALGGFEIWHDGYPAVVFKKGQIEATVWGDLLPHIFSHDHTKVHTKDGDFVHRVAVKPTAGTSDKDLQQLVTEYGDEVLDQSPIEIVTKREGWDTRDVDLSGREYVDVRVPLSELRENVGNRGARLAFQER